MSTSKQIMNDFKRYSTMKMEYEELKKTKKCSSYEDRIDELETLMRPYIFQVQLLQAVNYFYYQICYYKLIELYSLEEICELFKNHDGSLKWGIDSMKKFWALARKTLIDEIKKTY